MDSSRIKEIKDLKQKGLLTEEKLEEYRKYKFNTGLLEDKIKLENAPRNRKHTIERLKDLISKAKTEQDLEDLAFEVGYLQGQPEYVEEYGSDLEELKKSIEKKYPLLYKLKRIFRRSKRASQIRTASKMLNELNQEIKDLKKADLVPPLGKPGGIDHTRDRIIKNVTNPSLEQRLIKKLEQGQNIENAEASEVYTYVDCNKSGLNKIKQFCISSHAQYRMDQRGISVHNLKSFFFNLEKYYERNEYNLRAKDLISAIDYGMKAEWTDPMTKNLTVAFEFDKNTGTAKIITAYFKDKRDPIKV